MKKGILRPAAFAALCSALALAGGIVRADVTIDRTVSVEGVGAMALANMSGTSRTVISGNKARTDADMKMQSKLIGFFARNAVGPSADIILLGDDKMYHLNMNKKEYTETTFEQLHAQMQKMSDQMSQSQSGEGKQPSAVDQSKCEWLPAKVSVNRSGEKATFAGYDAERVTVTAVQPCQDKESGSICDVVIILDQWMSSSFTDSAETRNFYSAYAAKAGLDPASLQDSSDRAKAMFSQYKGLWAEVATKMQGMKGYPVRNSFTLALGGTQCKDPKAQQTQSSASGQSGASDDSPQNPGDLATAMAGKLGGLFHKKKDDSETPPPAARPTVAPVPVPAGDVALMTVSSQLVAVSTSSVGPEAFGVPPDFKKVELKTQ